MQRWFFSEEVEVCETPKVETPPPTPSEPKPPAEKPVVEYERRWHFCVTVQERLAANERVAVTGNCASLGNWRWPQFVLMSQRKDTPNMWQSNTLLIPRYKPTEYRYFIVAEDTNAGQVIVRRWGTHLRPRIVPPQAMGEPDDKPNCNDLFGMNDNKRKVERGWLTSETYVQLTFVHAPFAYKSPTKPRLLQAKITPMRMKPPTKCSVDPLLGALVRKDNLSKYELSSSSSSSLSALSTAFAFCEVATLKEHECKFVAQPKWGVYCDKEEIVVFHLTLGDFDNTAYMIDLYTYSSKAAADEPPYHFGYYYLQPQQWFKQSHGHFKLPMTCASTHRPVGTMQLDYLIMRPVTPPLVFTMHKSYMRYWNPKFVGVEAGHRGCGKTFVDYEGVVRENTLYSLKRAAKAGADMLEFDVHLTKDLVPVIYHDFMFYMASKPEDSPNKADYKKVPLSDHTLIELQHLRVSEHCGEGYFWRHECRIEKENRARHPFPQLAELFDKIDAYVAFYIEVKWSQCMADKSMEESYTSPLDPNVYADRILEVVLRKAEQPRRIFFGCFDANMCLLLRYKQNRYPVVLATMTEECPVSESYVDQRVTTIKSTICTALSNEMLGIAMPSDYILQNPRCLFHIRNAHLVLFVWGSINKDIDTVQKQVDMGVHVIIYDKIHVLVGKAIMLSIFGRKTVDKQHRACWPQRLEKKKHTELEEEEEEEEYVPTILSAIEHKLWHASHRRSTNRSTISRFHVQL